MLKVLPFLLCGGAGTRLWPLSREAYPKQFHRLTGNETLFQGTCRRLLGPGFGALWVLANHRHRFLIAEQLEQDRRAGGKHRARTGRPQYRASRLRSAARRPQAPSFLRRPMPAGDLC